MSIDVTEPFDPELRAAEKTASRVADRERLAKGMQPTELRAENAVFRRLPLHRMELVAIGDVKIR